MSLSGIRKAIASAVGVALTALTFAHHFSFLPSTWQTVIGILIAVLTPIVTWLVPNKTPEEPPQPAA
jgi:hypothetical protein